MRIKGRVTPPKRGEVGYGSSRTHASGLDGGCRSVVSFQSRSDHKAMAENLE